MTKQKSILDESRSIRKKLDKMSMEDKKKLAIKSKLLMDEFGIKLVRSTQSPAVGTHKSKKYA